MIHVALLVTDLQPGGTPLRVCRWAEWLRAAGYRVSVGCVAQAGPLSERLASQGFETFAGGARHRFDVTALVRLTRHLRRLRPDVLHSFLFHANLAARLIGRLDADRPIVTSTATIEIERRWHLRIERRTGAWSDAHICNAPAVARHVVADLGFPVQRVFVVPNGIDLAAIEPVTPISRASFGLPEHVPLIAWAGRMDPIKNLETWMRAFDAIRRAQPVCGVWIGDGPMRETWQRALRELDLEARANDASHAIGRIRLVGWSDAVIGWLKAADLFMLTSRTEGSPNVVLEAMAAGCPVIASAVGGCTDVIKPGVTGWLCNPNDPLELERAALAALSNQPLCAKVAAAARIWVAQHESKATAIQALKRVYGTVIHRRH